MMRSPIVFLTAALLAAFLAGAAGRARADADPREVEARRRCLSGEVQAGVGLLADLYIETRNTTYIYNQARCFQQNGRPAEAVQRFREYLRVEKQVSPDEREKVETFIRELEAEQKSAASRTAATRPAAPPAPIAPPPVEVVTRPPPRPAPISGRRWMRPASLAAGGVAAASLVVGLYLGTRVKAAEHETESLFGAREMVPAAVVSEKDGDGRRLERAQWIFYGVGLAAAAGGVTLFLLERATPRETALALTPLAGPGLVGAAAAGRF